MADVECLNADQLMPTPAEDVATLKGADEALAHARQAIDQANRAIAASNPPAKPR